MSQILSLSLALSLPLWLSALRSGGFALSVFGYGC